MQRNLCLYLEKGIEGSTIESLSKSSNHKNNNIPNVSGVYHQICFILAVHYYTQTVLIIPEKLHLIHLKINKENQAYDNPNLKLHT